MIKKALKSGLNDALKYKNILLIYYLTNLFCGLIIVLPIRAILNQFIGASLMGKTLAGRLDMDFFFEFMKYFSKTSPAVIILILFVTGIYFLINLFLSGGTLTTFADKSAFSAKEFWGNSGKFFGRFIRLLLWSIPIFILILGIQYIWQPIERIFFGKDPLENITFWGGWIKLVLRGLSLMLFNMIFDYARIHTVLTDEIRMRYSIMFGFKFTFEFFKSTFGLAFLIFLIGTTALLAYNPIADLLTAPNAFIILLLFLLQQTYIFFKMGLRLVRFSSQIYLYTNLSEDLEASKIQSNENLQVDGAINTE